MRKPIRPNPQKQRVTRAYTVPAAVGGLNARESISNMPETDCIIATNVICDTDAIRIRPGHKIHASGMNGNVESLMEWSGPGATANYFSHVSLAIYLPVSEIREISQMAAVSILLKPIT